MHKFSTRDLTLAALIAAVYAVLTVTLPIPQYSGIQVRLAEALTVLPFLFPAATPGLVVGCFIANLFSPFPLDILFGTAATLFGCWATQYMPSRWLAPLPPVIFNAVIVGAEIAWTSVGFTAAFWPAFAFNAFTVGLGELLACYILGAAGLLYSGLASDPRSAPHHLFPGSHSGGAALPSCCLSPSRIKRFHTPDGWTSGVFCFLGMFTNYQRNIHILP